MAPFSSHCLKAEKNANLLKIIIILCTFTDESLGWYNEYDTFNSAHHGGAGEFLPAHHGGAREFIPAHHGGAREFVPAPPGRTPPCAQPGLTYCVDSDSYPTDIIRELVEFGQYDISTLLSDESREEFGATKPSRPPASTPQYPYAKGPNSLPSTNQISLVNEGAVHNYPPAALNYQNPGLQPPPIQNAYYPPAKPIYPNVTQLAGYRPQQRPVPNQQYYQPGYQPAYDYYNSHPNNQYYNNHNIYPSYNLPQNGWARFSNAPVSQNNPSEWWRYINPARSSNVQIEQSIALEHSITDNGEEQKHRVGRDTCPKKHLKDAIRSMQGYSKENSKVKIETRKKESLKTQRNKRQSNESSGESLCASRAQYVTPKAALNNRGSWKYVVNMDDSMTQLVKSEICISQECNGLCSLPVGYRSRCEQKYIQKRLVALDTAGKRLYTDVFWIPSCCQCTIINDAQT